MNIEIQNIIAADPALVSALLATPLFSRLSEDEFNIITEVLFPVHVKGGDSIFKEGDAGEDMYVFLQGALSAYNTQSDGTQRKLFDIRLGDFFGEMSIIAHEPRSATITASINSILIMLKKTDFYGIIKKHPAIGVKILKSISVVQNGWLNQTSKSYNDLIRWGETARRRAITDEMTGLYNLRFLEESLKERISNQLRITSLLMMDLDRIHSINDKYGPKGGDSVIIAAAEEISSSLRPGDIAARLSGDEFAILLPDTDKKNSAKIAERIRANIEKRQVEVPASPALDGAISIGTCTSIGIAIAPTHANTVEQLMEVSDAALRKAKALGRNRVEVYSC